MQCYTGPSRVWAYATHSEGFDVGFVHVHVKGFLGVCELRHDAAPAAVEDALRSSIRDLETALSFDNLVVGAN
jgi:hypothetical protein